MKKYAEKVKGGTVVDPSSEDVGETLVDRDWHPLVALTAKAFRHATADARTGVLAYPPGVHLDLRVSRPLLERSLRFTDRLLRRLDEAGMKVDPKAMASQGRYKNAVTVDGVQLRFYLMERLERVPHVLTAAERAKMRRYEDVDSSRRWDWRPTGRLAFRLGQDYAFATPVRRQWEDGPEGKIEGKIDSILRGLRKASASRKLREERFAQAQREMAEAARERERAEAARRAEEEELREFEEEAERWFRACRLRKYIAAVEADAEHEGGCEVASELGQWLRRARAAADRLDPLASLPEPPPDESPSPG